MGDPDKSNVPELDEQNCTAEADKHGDDSIEKTLRSVSDLVWEVFGFKEGRKLFDEAKKQGIDLNPDPESLQQLHDNYIDGQWERWDSMMDSPRKFRKAEEVLIFAKEYGISLSGLRESWQEALLEWIWSLDECEELLQVAKKNDIPILLDSERASYLAGISVHRLLLSYDLDLGKGGIEKAVEFAKRHGAEIDIEELLSEGFVKMICSGDDLRKIQHVYDYAASNEITLVHPSREDCIAGIKHLIDKKERMPESAQRRFVYDLRDRIEYYETTFNISLPGLRSATNTHGPLSFDGKEIMPYYF